jgi:hypothetical protein
VRRVITLEGDQYEGVGMSRGDDEGWSEDDLEKWLEDDDEWEELYDHEQEKPKTYAAILKGK